MQSLGRGVERSIHKFSSLVQEELTFCWWSVRALSHKPHGKGTRRVDVKSCLYMFSASKFSAYDFSYFLEGGRLPKKANSRPSCHRHPMPTKLAAALRSACLRSPSHRVFSEMSVPSASLLNCAQPKFCESKGITMRFQKLCLAKKPSRLIKKEKKV